jgi:hypothetical protein
VRITIIAWEGDPNLGFYVVPEDKAQEFLDRYNETAEGRWKVWKPLAGPQHFLSMD